MALALAGGLAGGHDPGESLKYMKGQLEKAGDGSCAQIVRKDETQQRLYLHLRSTRCRVYSEDFLGALDGPVQEEGVTGSEDSRSVWIVPKGNFADGAMPDDIAKALIPEGSFSASQGKFDLKIYHCVDKVIPISRLGLGVWKSNIFAMDMVLGARKLGSGSGGGNSLITILGAGGVGREPAPCTLR